MPINFPRQPLNYQNPDLNKAQGSENESYESFRPNVVHPSYYREMENRATVSPEYRVRRYPNGQLDMEWICNQVLDAVHAAEYNGVLLPLDKALLTVVFPMKYQKMDPSQSEILTQLSDSEKKLVAEMVEAKMRERDNYNAGQGGSVPGHSTSNVGG